MGKRVMWCKSCGNTRHKYVGTKESAPYRILTGIATFGMSEAWGLHDKYYECTKCGRTRKEE